MESAFIAWLRERLPPHPLLLLGPGDDAAVLDLSRSPRCFVTVDMVCDSVDFDLSTIDARRAGRKALAVNLSDAAAMAGRPLAAVVALSLPRENALPLAQQLYEGLLPLAEKYDVPIIGGDISVWEHPLCVAITLIGEVTSRGPLKRDGARPGDRILVTGDLGGSILGKHLDFEPRVHEALLLHERYELHAGMDISDGLALDLSRLAAASGCGAVVEGCIPVSLAAMELTRQLGGMPESAIDRALGDGEDFELLLAAPPDEADRLLRDQPLAVRISDIGEFVAEPGLWRLNARRERIVLEATGYEHGT